MLYAGVRAWFTARLRMSSHTMDSSLSCFARSFARFTCLSLEVACLSVMGSCAMSNSLQTPIMSTLSTGKDDVANVPSTSQSGGSLEGLPSVHASGEAGTSPEIVSLIAQTVWAALAAERANNSPSSLASTPPIPSVSCPSVPWTTTSVC